MDRAGWGGCCEQPLAGLLVLVDGGGGRRKGVAKSVDRPAREFFGWRSPNQREMEMSRLRTAEGIRGRAGKRAGKAGRQAGRKSRVDFVTRDRSGTQGAATEIDIL